MFFSNIVIYGNFLIFFVISEMTVTYGEFDSKMFDFMTFIQYVIFRFFAKKRKMSEISMKKHVSKLNIHMGEIMKIKVHMGISY